MSSALVQTTCYFIATSDYPECKEVLIGYIEAVMGIGLILGPIIGSVLYAGFGFEWTFYIYGAFLFVFSLAIRRLNGPAESSMSSTTESLRSNLVVPLITISNLD
jgi:MFS family permease